MHLRRRQVLVATEVRFYSQLSVPEVEAAMERIERQIHATCPVVDQTFIEG